MKKFKVIQLIDQKPPYPIGTYVLVKQDRKVYRIMPDRLEKYWKVSFDFSKKRIDEWLFGLKNKIRYVLRIPIIVNTLTNLPFWRTVRNGTRAKIGNNNYKLHLDKWLLLDPIYKNYRDVKSADISNSVTYTSEEIKQKLKEMKTMMRNIP